MLSNKLILFLTLIAVFTTTLLAAHSRALQNALNHNINSQSHQIHIELGEDYFLTKKFNKIWIENKNLIVARIKKNKFYLKTLKIGTTHFRLDNTLYKVVISPLGSKKTYADWKNLVNKFVGLNVDYCAHYVCLKGILYRVHDYERIIDHIDKNDAKIYLALNVDPSIAIALQKIISAHLRSKGLTPLKIHLPVRKFKQQSTLQSDLWKIFYTKVKYKTENESKLTALGLHLEYLPQTTDVADNIKVAVKIVEITKNFERKLGVRWPDSYQAQVINGSHINGENTFDLAIQAAEKAGEAKILASPNLICRSGKEADFFAGGEFPIKVLNLRSKEILWKRYGIGLKLRPLIDPLGQMSLHIESEVSTLDRSITVDDVPAIHSNRVSSFFDLTSSQTIAISGLIKSEISENSEGLPFLKNIPILGALFRSKNFQSNKSELVIFVTPELMN